MEKDWVLVFSTGLLYQAEMVKDILEDNDLEAIVINKQDSFYKFGDIEVYTRPVGVIRAKHLIKKIK